MLQTGVQGGFSIGGNLFSAREAKKANERNVALMRESWDRDERLSNTAWQRGVADMKAAGINPMLAFSQGGASTPTSSATKVDVVPEWSAAMSSAAKAANFLDLQQRAANIEYTRAQADAARSDAEEKRFWTNPEMLGDKYKWQWDTNHWMVEEAKARIAQLTKQGDLTTAQAKQILEMLPYLMRSEEARARLTGEQATSSAQTRRLQLFEEPEREATAKWFKEMGNTERYINLGGKARDLGIETIMRILSRGRRSR